MVKCNIEKYLNKLGMSQKELADKIGTSEVSVSRYISGQRIPKATTCIQIAKILNCKVEELYQLNTKKDYRSADCKNDKSSICGKYYNSFHFCRTKYINIGMYFQLKFHLKKIYNKKNHQLVIFLFCFFKYQV